ncbi:MAG: phosphonopyruvate decarboxylase [Agathobacter sp.]|nr:phosphonopyruvate decarboxylase [Agathobacter sp.]
MNVEKFVEIIKSDFYVGVPDSQLKKLCEFLLEKYGMESKHHIIAANEGNCVAIAAGYHLATGKVPVVYMQNSGEGNIVNPVVSLLNEKVYGIPMVFVVGWRGEPGVSDEPQHAFQGEITLKLLEDMGISTFVLEKETTEENLEEVVHQFQEKLSKGLQVAFVVKKNALEGNCSVEYENKGVLKREEVISHIVKVTGEDPIISTTGKVSRELFEVRTANGQEHSCDFLTVGSMGHSSSIALGVALASEDKRIWCIDGDGAALMHMGAMGVIGAQKPKNLVHILINNGAHESVGGMPTVVSEMDMVSIAKACGYPYAKSVENMADLEEELKQVKERDELSFLEIKCAIGSRSDLGRPTLTPIRNKELFMEHIRDLNG